MVEEKADRVVSNGTLTTTIMMPGHGLGMMMMTTIMMPGHGLGMLMMMMMMMMMMLLMTVMIMTVMMMMMMIMTMKMMISHPDSVMMIMRTWVVLGDAYFVFCSGHILADELNVTKRS